MPERASHTSKTTDHLPARTAGKDHDFQPSEATRDTSPAVAPTFFPVLPLAVCRKTPEFPTPARNSFSAQGPLRQKSTPRQHQRQNLPHHKHQQFLPIRIRAIA
ncbi:MAG: hypothetical protein ACKO2P_20705 [Planctomycetota bacterium]